jgi:undecaprenyl-diphosphatase
MIEFLYGLDRSLLLFLNRTIANPVMDTLWPLITDYDKLLPVRVVLGAIWLWLLIWGGKRGRTAALLLIPLLVLSDQLNSTYLKELFHRPRPCHLVGGVPVVPELHLIVGCGGGMSFPSSHAVNNFSVAAFLGAYYRRARPWLLGWASVVALSRPALGVHYPSDIVAGAIVGIILGLAVVAAWTWLQKRYLPRWSLLPPEETRDDLVA